MTTHTERLARARVSLEGLSLGDSFGERFFMHAHTAQAMIRARAVPNAPWTYTDDTNMALSIYAILSQHQTIAQDDLIHSFAKHYDPMRGYGAAMPVLFSLIAGGDSWTTAAPSLFDGSGSFGNGAAMRVAPLGAYFADDLDHVVDQARKSAEVTHAHPEAIAGAIGVAIAAAVASNLRDESPSSLPTRSEFIDRVLPYIPESEVRRRSIIARDLRSETVDDVISQVGNGYRVTAQDTVAFTLWCAGGSLDEFEDAMWLTASGLGDVDTNCAIVGGIVAAYVGNDGLPSDWLANCEPLPEWAINRGN